MRFTLMTAGFLIVAGAAAASDHQHVDAPRLNLTQQQALKVATRTASREGKDLAAVQLQPSQTKLEGQQWRFVFLCKKPQPQGACAFNAQVDRQSGATTFQSAP